MNLFLYFTILLIVITNNIIKNNKNICVNLFKPCARLLLKEAARNNIIALSAVSYKFIIQIKNYWITSAIPNNYTNIVFVASDYSTFKFCKTLTKYVLMGRNVINQTKEIVFMNKDYCNIIVSRLEMIHVIIKYGLSVIMNDLDIHLFKNPIPYLLEYSEDIIASLDIPGYINGGF